MGRIPKPQKAYKRSQRKQQVINQMRIWYEDGYATEATSYKLAEALGMRPAKTFTDILNEMVSEGDLEVVEREQSGRWKTRFYLLASSRLITEKFSRRHISVKSRGQIVGQMELFS